MRTILNGKWISSVIKNKWVAAVGRSTWIVATWAPVVLTFNQVVAQPSWVQGDSMKPSMNPDESLGWRDIVLLKRYGIHKKDGIQVGDVVLLYSPLEPEKIMIKRVLAVGGQIVRPRPTSQYPKHTCIVPPGHIWVEGDNIHSRDSNDFGPVSEGLVIGSAKYILFPFWRIGPIPSGGRHDAVVQRQPSV